MDNLTMAAHDFMELVKTILEGMGLFLSIRDVEADLGQAKYKVTITNNEYGNTYELAVSRPMFLYERSETANGIARNLHYNFHRDLDYFIAETAYKALSNEAKAAFNTACLERYLELESYERKLATELYESGLFDGYADGGISYGYMIIPKRTTMWLWSRMKGEK